MELLPVITKNMIDTFRAYAKGATTGGRTHEKAPRRAGQVGAGSARPRALFGVSPIDLSVAAGHHGLLMFVPSTNSRRRFGRIVRCDAAKADGPSDHHSAKVIAGCGGRDWIGSFPAHLGGVDAGQPDPFSSCRPASVTVVAVADGHGL